MPYSESGKAFEDISDEENVGSLDRALEEDDIFSRPTAKYVLKSGKLISQSPVVEEDSDALAAEAGEAVAMQNLRLSEDSLPPEVTSILQGRQSPEKKPALNKSTDAGLKQMKRAPSPKQANIRRAALISSGTAAHQYFQARNLDGSFSRINPPPFPVPTRLSSRKPPKSLSEGGRSPTPSGSGASPTKRRKGKSSKPVLRKVRSAAAVSPGPDPQRQRSRSPPLKPRISVVPDLPMFPPIPVDNIITSQEKNHIGGIKPPPVENRRPSHAKTDSNADSIQQTSVVDAIAQAMVGEWMYKYVRRRKSFGVQDSKPANWDSAKNVEEISASVTSTGVRHKRWVWVAPYERAVMWSSKQPTSGTALLGKSGRKCKLIQELVILSRLTSTQ